MADEIRRANEAPVQAEQYEDTYFDWQGNEIRVGCPHAMKYPPDWPDERLRTRVVNVIYWRPDGKLPWELYLVGQAQYAKARKVFPDERAKCQFFGELVYLEKGKLRRRLVTRTGWDDKWNTAIHGADPMPDRIPPPEGAASEFVQLARTAQLKQAERDKAVTQRANEFDDVEIPEPPPFEDELGEPV